MPLTVEEALRVVKDPAAPLTEIPDRLVVELKFPMPEFVVTTPFVVSNGSEVLPDPSNLM